MTNNNTSILEEGDKGQTCSPDKKTMTLMNKNLIEELYDLVLFPPYIPKPHEREQNIGRP
jgi:hypothetical protein